MIQPNQSHGAPTLPLEPELLLSSDPDLWLVAADMHAWSEAHPCDCEGTCECEEVNT